jgi:hypothetical protein
VAVFTIPSDLLEVALDRLAAIGASPADRRDALAILALAVADLSPQSFATSRGGAALADRLGLDMGRWRDIIAMLESVGLVQRTRRRGAHRLQVTPPAFGLPGLPDGYAPPESRVV